MLNLRVLFLLNEFRYNPDLKVGDKVEVLVDIQEDKTGQTHIISQKGQNNKSMG